MTDVAVIGAGPVGLLMAALLARQGRSVTVFEQKNASSPGSNAIGVTPPSLEVLHRLGLADSLIAQGTPLKEVFVFGKNQKALGTASFQDLPGAYPFILSVPQPVTERVLEEHLAQLPQVKIHRSQGLSGFQSTPEGVTLQFQQGNTAEAQFVVGCDGARSTVRELLGVTRRSRWYPASFLMADYPDETGWGTARLFFTPGGAVESFPHAPGWRRWIVQTESYLEEPGDLLEQLVLQRTGYALDPNRRGWQSPFGVHRWVAPRYDFGRVFLAGDSAHQMSPIGGQGMNTGFADAEFLASLLAARLDKALTLSEFEVLSAEYTRVRKKAAQVAASRAALSMKLGTITGWGAQARDALLAWFLTGPLRGVVAPRFAMKTIPGRSLETVPDSPLVTRLKEYL